MYIIRATSYAAVTSGLLVLCG